MGRPDGAPVDAVLLLYARGRGGPRGARGRADARAREPASSVVRRLGTADLDGFEPFGFRDGISQPFVEGLGKAGPPETTVRAGEFLLGYANEYGRYTDRPLLDPADDPQETLPGTPTAPGAPTSAATAAISSSASSARTSAGSGASSTRRRAGADGSSDPAARLRLAAKMVGRWPSGAPLTLAPDADDPALADANDFAYHEHDRRGTRCPVGSHIRRSNPRDSLDPRPGSDRSCEVNRRHRILRRGREYGPPLPIEQALAGDDAAERGLHFICLNANIARQFEFVNHTWLNNPKFDRLYDDADPSSRRRRRTAARSRSRPRASASASRTSRASSPSRAARTSSSRASRRSATSRGSRASALIRSRRQTGDGRGLAPAAMSLAPRSRAARFRRFVPAYRPFSARELSTAACERLSGAAMTRGQSPGPAAGLQR